MGTGYKLFANEVNFKKYLASLSWVEDLDSRYKGLPTQSKIADLNRPEYIGEWIT